MIQNEKVITDLVRYLHRLGNERYVSFENGMRTAAMMVARFHLINENRIESAVHDFLKEDSDAYDKVIDEVDLAEDFSILGDYVFEDRDYQLELVIEFLCRIGYERRIKLEDAMGSAAHLIDQLHFMHDNDVELSLSTFWKNNEGSYDKGFDKKSFWSDYASMLNSSQAVFDVKDQRSTLAFD